MKDKKLSKEAREGLEYAVSEVERGVSLKKIGIETLADTVFFLQYLRDTNREHLIKKLV